MEINTDETLKLENLCRRWATF